MENTIRSIPSPCIGLEDCKNIIDVKFGHCHQFVQSSDNNIFICGNDSSSSPYKYFLYEMDFPYFNKNTRFNEIAKENEGIKLIAVNDNNTSILLTNNNKMFCYGQNKDGCLGNSLEDEKQSTIPTEMAAFPVIKVINNGLK